MLEVKFFTPWISVRRLLARGQYMLEMLALTLSAALEFEAAPALVMEPIASEGRGSCRDGIGIIRF